MIKIEITHKFTVPLYNKGNNESNITLRKEQVLMDAIRKHTDLIDLKKHYPVNDIIELDAHLDIVILKRSEYESLLGQAVHE